jgi:hypothetical protein
VGDGNNTLLLLANGDKKILQGKLQKQENFQKNRPVAVAEIVL